MKMSPSAPLLLVSGLPLHRKSSFFRQLDSLASTWRRRGRSVYLCGPVSSGPSLPAGGWLIQGDAAGPLEWEEILERTRAGALIALGYPDQFPFPGGRAGGRPGAGPPVFLWSQLSRVPRNSLPGEPVYVPLTAKTMEFLRSSGCSRLGPIIGHGVDTNVFAPAPARGRSGPFVIGAVGNNSRRKRYDLIIRSFARFTRSRPDSQLLIKTDRPVSLDGVDLPALCSREGVADRVEILARELSSRAMAELYRRMGLYLNLSEWEGFCIPVIEAMACGLPVACLPAQGPGEILPYRETLIPGSLLRQEEGTALYEADPRSVEQVLVAVAGRSGLLARLGRQGRAAAVRLYDIRRIAAQWEALLQRGVP
jgi:glycosyltransferase involved in cell wall biosynthesis